MHERLEAASRYLAGAMALVQAGDYAGAISRCYYAAYQAMWAALGEPVIKRRWEHAGIIQAFVRGRWDDLSYSMTGPGLYDLNVARKMYSSLCEPYKIRLTRAQVSTRACRSSSL